MTISELEQGIRNLIASQPNVLSGTMGEVVRGVLSIVETYREFSIKVQSYPAQDMLKFTLVGEARKTEETVTNLVCLVLQERGINIALYTPNGADLGQMSGANFARSNFSGGQMVYSQNAGAALGEQRNNASVVFPKAQSSQRFEDTQLSETENFDIQTQSQAVQSPNFAEEEEETESKPSGMPHYDDLSGAESVEQGVGDELEQYVSTDSTPEMQGEQMTQDLGQGENFDGGSDIMFDMPPKKSDEKPASSAGRDYLVELLNKK